MPVNPRADRYSHTPRKVFNAYVDRMALKRSRDREDNRNDLHLMMTMIKHLQEELLELKDHVASHCRTLRDPDDPVVEYSTEEL